MSGKIRKSDALYYHEKGKRGKIEVIPTKETKTQRDLALAYSPGVAEPCKAIAENVNDVYKYTAKGNLVGVISNGTAVLGLGDIGPEASKPVMEGKGVLFKIFSDIDVFDIELKSKDVNEFVNVVKALEPTFGGINLEDIKAPECFEIETRLKEELNIPIMHDDQHGTAIISSAGIINALEIAGKKIDEVKIVVCGAGAAAISCTKLYVSLGAKIENIVMVDVDGVLNKKRTDIDQYRSMFITDRDVNTLAEAMVNADVFLGLSAADVVSQDMIKSMAKKPIVFALANPNPEITYEKATEVRDDLIIATGRSDYPNQVNNVIGFPFIFRGALDVGASEINEAMKLAAVKAIAALAREPVPDIVNLAYNETNLTFGEEYILPKPLDPRLLTVVSPAVAKAAMDSGVAKFEITDWNKYQNELNKRLGRDEQIMRILTSKAKRNPKKVLFAEAEHLNILKAAQVIRDEGIGTPILLGNRAIVKSLILEHSLDLDEVEIIDPRMDDFEENRNNFGDLYFQKRKRKGVTLPDAKKIMRDRTHYGLMMLDSNEIDVFISSNSKEYQDTLKPALQIIGLKKEVKKVAGMYVLLTKKGPLFCSDTTVNVDPTTEDLIDITLLTANEVEQFNVKPKIAMLSYSNFGTGKQASPTKVRKAAEYLHKFHPELIVDGEMQANLALNTDTLDEMYPFCQLDDKGANTLIFPNLSAGNIAYKLLQEVGGCEAIGPILMGLKKPVQVLQLGSSVRDIVNMVTIGVVESQIKNEL